MSASPPLDTVRVTFPSNPRYLPLVRAVAEQGATVAGFVEEERQRIVLAVTEGVSNVMRHGYGGRRDEPIDLVLEAALGCFRLEIHDRAQFTDPADMSSRNLDDVRPGGLGVHLMKATMDTVEYCRNEQGGTTLTLLKRTSDAGESS